MHFGVAGAHSVCIRTFITNDFMTGKPALPGVDFPAEACVLVRMATALPAPSCARAHILGAHRLQQMVDGVLAVPGVARVLYDLTGKPPGTTEWE